MADRPTEHRLYGELGVWWPLISPPEEYVEEAAYAATVLGSASIPVREVLELGSGGGHSAAHLRHGGIAVFVPDRTAEAFEATSDHGGNDGVEGRGVRYLECA